MTHLSFCLFMPHRTLFLTHFIVFNSEKCLDMKSFLSSMWFSNLEKEKCNLFGPGDLNVTGL